MVYHVFKDGDVDIVPLAQGDVAMPTCTKELNHLPEVDNQRLSFVMVLMSFVFAYSLR